VRSVLKRKFLDKKGRHRQEKKSRKTHNRKIESNISERRRRGTQKRLAKKRRTKKTGDVKGQGDFFPTEKNGECRTREGGNRKSFVWQPILRLDTRRGDMNLSPIIGGSHHKYNNRGMTLPNERHAESGLDTRVYDGNIGYKFRIGQTHGGVNNSEKGSTRKERH